MIGIIARDSAWPPQAQAWIPMQWGGQIPAEEHHRVNHRWGAIARLQPGIAIPDASAQVRDMARQIYAGDDSDERDKGTEAMLVGLGPSRTPEEAAARTSVKSGATRVRDETSWSWSWP